MITNIKITDNTNIPFNYASGLKAFENGKEYSFKSGINIIIGENGCGKSTLMKNIAAFLLCNDTYYSKMPKLNNMGDALSFSNLLYNIVEDTLKDGIKIKCDYAGVAYHYITHNEANKDNGILSSVENFNLFISSIGLSTGETMYNDLNNLFQLSFKNKNVQFPISDIINIAKNSNDVWKERLKKLVEYYKDNILKISQEEFEYTYLLDEPDRNLDITKVDDLYQVLSHKKEMAQLICVIHNPILIYKLSKLDYINFVEMTDGYLNKIKDVFKKL